MTGLLTHWLFLALVSALATAFLLVLSWEAFGTLHSSLIMVLRMLGVLVIAVPFAAIAISKGQSGVDWQTVSLKTIIVWAAVAITAGVSWYSFYLALDYGKTAGISIALITAINYSSLVLVLLLSWLLGRQQISLANIAGVILVTAGVYLVSLKSSPTPPEHPTSHS